MKIITTLFLLTSTFSFLCAQDCLTAIAHTQIDVNDVDASLHPSGTLWDDEIDQGYRVDLPMVDGGAISKNIMRGGIWMGGLDQGGNLKIAAATYGGGNSSDYWPGPISEMTTTDQETCENYDQLWTTTSAEIASFLSDWMDNGAIDDAIPNSILEWPALGNPYFSGIFGFELPTDHGMAPFIDIDGNGLYNPDNGDYPDIKGANQGTWWVFNDAGGIHTESGGDLFRMEVQVLAYAYQSSNSNINNTTYYDYKFINRAVEQYDSLYVGLWIDPELACSFTSTRLGCIPEEGLAFYYSSENPSSPCTGNSSDSDIINPLVSINMIKGLSAFENGTLVDRGMSSFMYYANAGVNPPPPPGTTDPEIASQYYNYLSGTWADGTPLIVGGSGYDPSNTDYTSYAFPGNPADPDAWSMCQEEQAGDYRLVIASGPVSMPPGAINRLSFAVTHTFAAGTVSCPDITVLDDVIDDVEALFEDISLSTGELADNQNAVRFYPNPMLGNEAVLEFIDLSTPVTQVQLFAVDGKMVQTYDAVQGNTLRIKRESLSAGIYFYKAIDQNRRLYTGKFLVQ